MPLNSDSPYTQSRQEFCLALKAARERKGVTLAEIAATTKIPTFMFAALEQGDLQRWPKGLFRRSFFRDYARIIGVPLAETCAEFIRLFPDHKGPEIATTAAPANESTQVSDLPLMLDEAWHGPRPAVLSRVLAAAIDTGAVILAAAAVAWAAGVAQAATTAVVALAYFSLSAVLLGETPATWALSSWRSILGALTNVPQPIAARWKFASDAISKVFGNAATDTDDSGEEPEQLPWITDAHSVGSAPSPRFRVRIKVS